MPFVAQEEEFQILGMGGSGEEEESTQANELRHRSHSHMRNDGDSVNDGSGDAMGWIGVERDEMDRSGAALARW